MRTVNDFRPILNTFANNGRYAFLKYEEGVLLVACKGQRVIARGVFIDDDINGWSDGAYWAMNVEGSGEPFEILNWSEALELAPGIEFLAGAFK
jgi:hypothetical protein